MSVNKIEVSCSTPDSEILYSLTSEEPNIQYTNSFSLDNKATITAKAIKEGYTESNKISKNYFVITNLGEDTELNNDKERLPYFYLSIKKTDTLEKIAMLKTNESFILEEDSDIFVYNEYYVEPDGDYRPDHSAGLFYCSFSESNLKPYKEEWDPYNESANDRDIYYFKITDDVKVKLYGSGGDIG